MSERDNTKGILRIIDARSLATIVRAADGGPIRRILPGGRTTPVGVMTSLKVGRPMWHEAPVEKVLIQCGEADPAVVTYMTQPHCLEFRLNGEVERYYPDMELTLSDGMTVVREGKGSKDRRMRDPRYLRKIERADRIYEDLGWRYEIITDAALLGSRRAQIAARMWSNRNVVVDPSDLYLVTTLLDAGTSTRADLIARLGDGPLGEARLDALAVRRVVTWDDFLERRTNSVCRSVRRDESPVL